jgi:hypothetical protein
VFGLEQGWRLAERIGAKTLGLGATRLYAPRIEIRGCHAGAHTRGEAGRRHRQARGRSLPLMVCGVVAVVEDVTEDEGVPEYLDSIWCRRTAVVELS